MSVDVKICGITTPEQALIVQSAGADALGLVLYEKSSRYIDLQQAIAIRAAIAPDRLCVVLLVNADAAFVKQVIREVKPDLLQFHGDETPAFCRQFQFPYIRALRMHDNLDINAEAEDYADAYGLLFDAWHADQYGGTGERFDWQRLPKQRNFKLILAGGLTPGNVGDAVVAVAPDMVDVSGGVEASAGMKDERRVGDFVARAKAAAEALK